MADFYKKMQKTADALLRKFGDTEKVELIREKKNPQDTEYNPGTPIRNIYEISAVFKLAYRKSDSFDDNSLVLENTRDLIVSAIMTDGLALPITPIAGDKLQNRDQLWTVVSAVPVSPGGVPLIYKLVVEK